MKREAVNHTKMVRLERRLDLRRYESVGLLELLWHLTAKEAPAGNIGKLSDEDIAGALGWEGDDVSLVTAMVEAGWLESSEEYRLIVHDWPDHCEDGVHAKLARLRLLFANGKVPSFRKLTKREQEEAVKHSSDGGFTRPTASENGKKAPNAPVSRQKAPKGAECARQPPKGADGGQPYPALPSPALPSHTKPLAGVREIPLRVLLQTSARFQEFWLLHPGKKMSQDPAARIWSDKVNVENEADCFACLENYLQSQEVANNAIMSPENWLAACAVAEFKCTWPKVRDPPKSKQQIMADNWGVV